MRYLKNTFRGAPGERIPHDLLNTLANFWNDLTVIGGKLRRRSDGRNTTIEITPGDVATDTDGYALTKNPDGRQSIQHNPEDYTDDDDSHANELQLHNLHQVLVGSGSIPVFFSETPLQGHVPDKVVGELYWATPDANRDTDGGIDKAYRSIDVADTHGTGSKGRYNLSLYGFTACGVSSVPYAKESSGLTVIKGRELEWRYPVTRDAGLGVYDPCNTSPVSHPVMASLSGVTEPPLSGSYAEVEYSPRDLVVTKGALQIGDNGSLLKHYYPVTIDPADIPPVDPSTIPHTDLDFGGSTEGAAGTNADHDQQYLQRGGKYNDTKTYANTCDSIANTTAGAYGIVFIAGQLLDASAALAVEYSGRNLVKTGGELSVDWGNSVLGETSAWYCARGFTAGFDPRTSDKTYSAHAFYSLSFAIEASAANAGGFLFKSSAAAGFNYFDLNTAQDGARFGTDGGNERVKIMSVAGGVDRTMVLNAVDGTPLMVADGTNQTVMIKNLRLDAGGGNWIGFNATAGQLIIVDQSGNQLALLATGEPA
jgi:hypothetical protein